MATAAARRSIDGTSSIRPADATSSVRSVGHLLAHGWSASAVRSQLDARRWQRVGRAVVLHNGPLTVSERRWAALVNCGPRSVLTAFTAAEHWGLRGWARPPAHVLVPAGARVLRPAGLSMVVHYSGDWASVAARRRVELPAPALLRAAANLSSPRHACGILAAGVQQRLVTAAELADDLAGRPRLRHHCTLRLAVQDIGQGAQALSEIDFARLCRGAGLPAPVRQRVRVEPDGRRRYLDAEWQLSDGRRVVVEIDGALHLVARVWWDDQLRQNELVLTGNLVLRFPSVVVRAEPQVVVDQLRRALRGMRA